MKSIFHKVILVALLFFFAEVCAADDHIPQVSIEHVVLDGDQNFEAGSVVTGSFTAVNYSDFDASELNYEIGLVGQWNSMSLPSKRYDYMNSTESLYLKAGEEKQIPFSYKLPANFGGKDLGFFIRAKLPTGFFLGFGASEHFNIKGGLPFLSVLYSAVDTSDKGGGHYSSYRQLEGPTIYSDRVPQIALARFTLQNDTKESITVTPHLTIYRRDTKGVPIYESELSDKKLTVAAGQNSKDTTVVLPVFDYAADIYYGEISFKDDNGIERSNRMGFRYIVGGEILTVHSLSSDKSALKKGEPVDLTLGYSGTPFDIAASSTQEAISQVVTVEIKLFNEKDVEVGEASNEIDFGEGYTAVLTAVAKREAKALRAELVVKRGETILGTYKFKLSGNYDAEHENAKQKAQSRYWMISALIGVIIGGGIAFLIKKKSK